MLKRVKSNFIIYLHSLSQILILNDISPLRCLLLYIFSLSCAKLLSCQLLSRSIFDFESIKKLLTSPKFTFWYPCDLQFHATFGIYSTLLFLDETYFDYITYGFPFLVMMHFMELLELMLNVFLWKS